MVKQLKLINDFYYCMPGKGAPSSNTCFHSSPYLSFYFFIPHHVSLSIFYSSPCLSFHFTLSLSLTVSLFLIFSLTVSLFLFFCLAPTMPLFLSIFISLTSSLSLSLYVALSHPILFLPFFLFVGTYRLLNFCILVIST